MTTQHNDALSKYREWLVEADHKAVGAYDKAIMWLSSGSLGITFAFIKDIVPNPKPDTIWLLGAGWSMFAITLLGSTLAQLISHKALRHAMKQVDKGRIYSESPGGWLTELTHILNWLQMVTLIVGVGLVIWFATLNLAEVANDAVLCVYQTTAAQ